MSDAPATKAPSTAKSAPLRVTFSAKHRAFCPMCAARLATKTLWFIHGTAFCHDCVADNSPVLYQLVSMLRNLNCHDHRREHVGLTFYVPRSNEIRDLHAQRAYDLRHAP